ncbi:MFS transporter [Nocardia araoensis]|uniref:MFS transporter n=1 Tax=Nocardia araoensis TaxID=228600 RepID=UPI0002EA50E2|nr:MFS transporter [Nocardia araoensis]
MTLPIVLTATFMQLLDVTIVVVAVPALQHDLTATAGTVELVVTAYTLAYACVLIPAARLGDRYGYRRLFIVGMGAFVLGSALAGVAPTVAVLIAARVIQGIGSGALGPQVLSIIQTGLPTTQRSGAMSWYGAVMGTASLLGPLVGGLLLAADVAGLGWRMIFLVNLPIGLFALVGARRLPRHAGATERPVPILSAVLVMIGTALLIYPLSVGREFGWPWWTGVCLAAAGAALAGFLVGQCRGNRPLLDPELLRARVIRRGIALVFVFNAAVPSFTLLLMHYLQTARGVSPITAAVVSAPFAATAIVGARSAPRLARGFGAGILIAASLSLSGVTGTVALAVTSAAPLWALLPVLAVGGAMFGVFTASVFGIIITAVPESATGSASGLLPTAQQLGGTFGITLAGLCYFGIPASPATAFGHALIYETVVFLTAAALAGILYRSLEFPVPEKTLAGS